ncbi:hypothetical protein [Kitasatospora sp. GAS1066B]|uniref:hypothetical protein n=1 Tax=Kitasatospora sp. GAS1066B TaxID=3156271 RepID=UPI0035168F61
MRRSFGQAGRRRNLAAAASGFLGDTVPIRLRPVPTSADPMQRQLESVTQRRRIPTRGRTEHGLEVEPK